MPVARRRSPLPYDVIAGVEPCPGGWLVVSARLLTTMVALERAEVLPSFVDVLDYRPSFSIVALHAPIGLLEKGEPGGRPCDRAARRCLGARRSPAVASAPSRAVLADPGSEPMSSSVRAVLPRILEVSREMQPYWQRTVYEVNPELGFYQLNGEVPMRWSKRTAAGRAERAELLHNRLPDMAVVLDAEIKGASIQHLLDATVDLWTARRIIAHAVVRLPDDPLWDDQGMRMEVVY